MFQAKMNSCFCFCPVQIKIDNAKSGMREAVSSVEILGFHQILAHHLFISLAEIDSTFTINRKFHNFYANEISTGISWWW